MGTNTLTRQSKQDRRLGIILATCCLSLFVVGVDSTIVNIALPSIQRSFGASTAGLQWTIDGYTVVLASLLMLSGSLADRLGRRRVFQAGLALFTVGSLLCSLAPGLGWLVAFRMLQAVGGSMLNPVALGDHRQHLHRPGQAGPGDGRVGERVRDQPRGRPGARRGPGRHDRLALHLLGQRAGRAGRDRADPAVRARVASAPAAAARPDRPDPDRRAAGRGHRRDHRGACSRAGRRR